VIDSLNRVFEAVPEMEVELLVETTAGQGTNLGHTFEQLAAIVAEVERPEKMGVCLDTCHIFAAGYELRDEEGYQTTFNRFDRAMGLERLKAFHLNDSLRPLGSRVDRHQQAGLAELGLGTFQRLVSDPRFADHPGVMEMRGDLGDFRKATQQLRRLARSDPDGQQPC
jgi:deoxyribonuclease-4